MYKNALLILPSRLKLLNATNLILPPAWWVVKPIVRVQTCRWHNRRFSGRVTSSEQGFFGQGITQAARELDPAGGCLLLRGRPGHFENGADGPADPYVCRLKRAWVGRLPYVCRLKRLWPRWAGVRWVGRPAGRYYGPWRPARSWAFCWVWPPIPVAVGGILRRAAALVVPTHGDPDRWINRTN